ncbi:hypothetical protein SME41J_36710 [Serratia marcescens]|nr:hypothetical protein SME41J_36710 [Serratia marcescens]
MKIFYILLVCIGALCSRAYAEIDNVCWTSPTLISVASLSLANFSSNKAGATGSVNYSSNPPTFNGICNRLTSSSWVGASPTLGSMTHYIDLAPDLPPSALNPGWYQLSPDIDIKVRTMNGFDKWVYLPVMPGKVFGFIRPEPICRECLVSGFSVAASGVIEIKLRRDIIGGAIVIAPNKKIFTAYRVADTFPFPNKPTRPMMELNLSSGGTIIPIPTECEINNGNVINIDFGHLPIESVATSPSQPYKDVSKNLSISCNTNLTQDAVIRLVSGTTSFSDDLIATSNPNLGIIMKNDNKIIKPHGTFPIRLENGTGFANITLFPVKNSKVQPSAGAFIASATLIVESL